MSDLDDAYRAAQSLEPDEQLQLVVRLWKALPRDHRSALVTLQLDDSLGSGNREQPDIFPTVQRTGAIWPKVHALLFDTSHSSGLYSAPRRFDLATIFVVTAAYSLLLGFLSAFGAPAIIMVVLAGLLAIIAAAQAMFAKVANPRGVSVVTGAVAYTVMSWIIWLTVRQVFPNSFIFVTFFNGMIGGAILGYLLGTLVGGVFLVADMLRGKFEGRDPGISENTEENSTPGAGPFADDAN